jgi:hypothetical protein
MSETSNESDLDFIRLLFRYLSRKLNIQHLLYFLVFMTFDIGDAVTASMMMDAGGISAENNFMVQYIYVNYGLAGLISAKLCIIIVPLIYASSEVKKSYWMINGVLVALITAGIMATQANLQKLAGLPHKGPAEVNIIYLKILLILVIAGMILDYIIPGDESNPIGI